MGILDGFNRRAEERRERERQEAAAKAQAEHASALEAWKKDREELDVFLEEVRAFTGLTKEDHPDIPVVLKKGERVFFVLQGASLIEPKRAPGHYEGGYAGASFRIAKGIRVHSGGVRGRYVAGPELPTPIEEGVVTITNQRVVFQGQRNAREWLFSKLIGAQHDPELPWTAMQVSNRQKVSGFLYDTENADWIRFRLELALAHHQGNVEQLARRLEHDSKGHDAERPMLAD